MRTLSHHKYNQCRTLDTGGKQGGSIRHGFEERMLRDIVTANNAARVG